MDRRTFLRGSAAAGGAVAGFGPSFWQAALAAPAAPGPGPYGPLGPPNADGVRVPEGFTARIVAIAGQPVGAVHQRPIEYVWPPFPDGAATYATPDGGWVLACNSEVPRSSILRAGLGVPADFQTGGCSSLQFDADGNVVDAWSILTGTDGNCAGGKTPWGTWISCEEPQVEPEFQRTHARGLCFECDPYQPGEGVPLPAMGLFKHEGVAIDPVNGHAFLTEDESDGAFYRFIPAAYPDLSAGTLQVADVGPDSRVVWHDVPDPSAETVRTADQVDGTTRFDGGEGIWYDEGFVYFTTKNDHRVWVHDIATQTISILYDAADHAETPLGPATPDDTSVDNVTVSPSGDLFVAEDGGNLEIVMITADTREVAAVMRLEGSQHGGSEICGPCFSPDGSRLYFSSQRSSPSPAGTDDPTGEAPIFGNGLGITYEVTGPWRTQRVGVAATGGQISPPAPQPTPPPQAAASDGAVPQLPATGGGFAASAIAIAAAAALRSRRRG